MQKISRLGLVLLGILGAIILSETILRLFWNPSNLDPRYIRDDLEWMKNNVKLNKFGYRDNDVSLLKFPDTLRIYSLGDSYTYGWYINGSQFTYPNILEEKLKSEEVAEVINASQPGFSLDGSLNRYQTEGILFAPDVVTLGINIFDLTEKEFPPESSKFKIFESSRLYQLTLGNIQRNKVAQKTRRELKEASQANSQQFKNTTETIIKLNKLVSENGGKLVLVIFPNYDPSSPNSPYEYFDFHKSLERLGSENSIAVVDLFKKYDSLKDKKELVLNPVDAHPSVKAHKLAADELFERLKEDFRKAKSQPVKQEIKKGFFGIGDSLDRLHSIISISSPDENWTYFNRINTLGIQKNVLTNLADRGTTFMVDYLKTAKSFTHEGWVGAQIEANFLGPKKQIAVNEKYYGFDVVGIHQITGFNRKNGSLESRDLEFPEISVEKTDGRININILTQENFDFYRIYFDVGVAQLDIDNGKIISAFKTEVVESKIYPNLSKVKLTLPESKSKLPQFVANGQSSGYVWYNGKLKKANFSKKDKVVEVEFSTMVREEALIELPSSKSLNEGEFEKPIVEYL